MNKSHNRKAKIFSLGLFVLFFGFIWCLLYPSDLSVASKELKIASSVGEVKNIWNKNKDVNLYNPDFYKLILAKLSSLNIPSQEVEQIFTWLPDRRQVNANVVVVPDLSARIVQEKNNPNQIENDKILLTNMWKTFFQKHNSLASSKSSFLITVTDDEQVRGDFYKIAKDLSVDFSARKDGTRVRDSLLVIDKNFTENLDKMYNLGKEKTSGANYWQFFDRKLSSYFKQPTLTDKFENKLIIVTDGYMELTDGTVYTKNVAGIGAMAKQGMSLETAMKLYGSPIVSTSYRDLGKWHVLMLEINERKSGLGSDFNVLKKYWTDWFMAMGYVQMDGTDFFVGRDSTTQVALNKIADFLK